jgi:hypothetical protein
MHTLLVALVCAVNETRPNKLVIPEGAAGVNSLFQFISVSLVFIYADLLCRTLRHDVRICVILTCCKKQLTVP